MEKQKAKGKSYFESTLNRFRHDMKMQIPYKPPPAIHKRSSKTSSAGFGDRSLPENDNELSKMTPKEPMIHSAMARSAEEENQIER